MRALPRIRSFKLCNRYNASCRRRDAGGSRLDALGRWLPDQAPQRYHRPVGKGITRRSQVGTITATTKPLMTFAPGRATVQELWARGAVPRSAQSFRLATAMFSSRTAEALGLCPT